MTRSLFLPLFTAAALTTLLGLTGAYLYGATTGPQRLDQAATQVQHIAKALELPPPPSRGGGALLAYDDTEQVPLPGLSLDIDAQIRGDIADVVMTQVFDNPGDRVMHARYTFPLPANAAVYGMRMRVGDELIEAEIQERQQAQATFEAAQEAGQTASLVQQERPNVFTQRLANLAPGLPVEVELRYQFTLPRVDGQYEVALPLLVGPRYNPGTEGMGPVQASLNRLVASPEPTSGDRSRVSLQVEIDGGLPVYDLRSPTHDLEATWTDETAVAVRPDAERIPDDGDFVLRYRLGGPDIAAGAVSEATEAGGTVSLRVEPPASIRDAELVPREVVFVLDTSGSMGGMPLDTSRALARRTLETLRPTDTFRIVQFGSDAREFAATPLPATPSRVAEGIAYLESLQGMGGTEMRRGVEQALRPEPAPGALRLVVFLTDGFIGNEAEILQTLEDERGDARLIAFGVGEGVNRYLLEEMGRSGRGFTRIMTFSEDPECVVDELHARLDQPVLTDLEIDWGGLPVTESYPSELPDLFAGHAVRVDARYTHTNAAQAGQAVLRGRRGDEVIEIPVDVELSAEVAPSDRRPLGRAWARAKIGDRMHAYRRASNHRLDGYDADTIDAIRAEVTALGLEHRLVTDWTSFVAVARRVVNPDPANTAEHDVAAAQMRGVSMQAYGGFAGAAAPEPATWLALLSALAAGGAGARRRRRR